MVTVVTHWWKWRMWRAGGPGEEDRFAGGGAAQQLDGLGRVGRAAHDSVVGTLSCRRVW